MATIYAIECIVTKRVYVGCTTSRLNRRLNEHRSLLRKGKHTASAMLADFEMYGDKSFWLKVLEVLPANANVATKREAELRWMRHFSDAKLLYNAQMISFGPGVGYKLRAHTPEANEKRRLAQLGKPKGHGAKISATKKAQKEARLAAIKLAS